MSNLAIKVENLSKQYRIGGPQERYRTFRDTLMNGIVSPFRKTRDLIRGVHTGAAGLTENIWALKDVSFEVEKGEVVGIIGRNGAGKTTVLKILSRITEPTEGHAEICGRIGSLLEVGTGFHPELTGRENTYLNGAILGMRKAEIDRKFDQIVAFAEIEKFIDTPVKHYSSGMYVRLAFAVAAHLEPEILLVDEVLAVGDVAFQKKCIGKMGNVAQEGRTVLFVSHNMAAIQSLCPSAMVLSEGVLRFRGSSMDAISQYLRDRNTTVVSPVIDLAHYRTMSEAPIFRTLSVVDEKEVNNTVFPIGSTIVLDLTLHSEKMIKTPHIGIGVNNPLGIRAFTVSTRYSKKPLESFQGETRIRAVLHDVLLTPGQYFLKATVGDFLRDLDVVESIPAFEISASDYWGTGKLPSMAQGLMIQNASWFSEGKGH